MTEKKTDSIVEEPFSILVSQGKTSFKVFQQISTFSPLKQLKFLKWILENGRSKKLMQI